MMQVWTVASGKAAVIASGTLRANKSETYWWLKFKLEGAGELTHGYALTGAAFGVCGVWRDATD
jgi:hypothetical protein